ncbi:hypothetical protein EYF80_038785 [Liparis tanakae]|uniref:Uncharacterized protein n=1 Tax=Liparis tanakae TaxID=230148 RepID=A0A4Z2GDK1_9TELE|nr:hypothetical protein EYF80_038785 [Liparis tanakae]
MCEHESLTPVEPVEEHGAGPSERLSVSSELGGRRSEQPNISTLFFYPSSVTLGLARSTWGGVAGDDVTGDLVFYSLSCLFIVPLPPPIHVAVSSPPDTKCFAARRLGAAARRHK